MLPSLDHIITSLPILIILIVVYCLLVIGTYFLSIKSNPNFKWLQFLLIALIYFGFAGILLQPTNKVLEPSFTAYLYTEAIADKENFKIGKDERHFQLDNQFNPNFENVINAKQILAQHPTVDSIIVLGNNLTTKQLQNWPAISTRFYNKNNSNSHLTVNFNYQKTILLGSKNNIELIIKDSLEQFSNYSVVHPFLQIDSGKIDNTDFKKYFSFNPTAAGNYVGSLKLKNNESQLIETFAFPFEVIDRKPIKIFIMNAYPNFESKYLATWLGEQGHQLLINTNMSKNKFDYKRVNLVGEGPIQFNQTNLKNIDLLIIDGTSLSKLTEYENNLLNQQMKKGLNVLIRYDAGINSNFKVGNNNVKISTDIKVSQAAYTLKNKANDLSLDVNFYPNQSSLKGSNTFSSIYNKQLLSHNRSTWNRLGITFIKDSHSALLNGDKVAYHWLWSSIINELLPADIKRKNEWTINEQYPTVSENISIQLITKEGSPIATITQPNNIEQKLMLTQDYVIGNRFYTNFKPEENGWHYFSTAKDKSKQTIYIYAKQDNKIEKERSKAAMKSALINSIENKKTSNEKLVEVYTKKPINPLLFWFLSIVSLATLWWLEKK